MHHDYSFRPTRRAFLQRSAALAVAGTAMPFALNLSAMGEAAAQSANDYKALVCVFLYGGCDYANTVVTYDEASHARYTSIRGAQAAGGMAIARDALAATALKPAVALLNGREYALNPRMTAIKSLFDLGDAAVMLNVGPLVVPLSRALYNSSNKSQYPIPPQLFSHNDQQSTWQSSAPEGATVGAGGNFGDAMIDAGANSNSLFTCISLSGNTVFLSGDKALCYGVGVNGATRISSINGSASTVFGSSTVKDAMAVLTQRPSAHHLENEYNTVTARAIGAERQISAAIGGANSAGNFPATSLGSQLSMVARLIRGRNQLGAKRQVFFVSMGSFDLHSNLMARHGPLVGQLSDALGAFQASMAAMGMNDKVTSFTASDFGRTLVSNGDGADHGWGNHHFIVGGAVKGNAFYGTPPPVSIEDNPALPGYEGHVGQGRLIPTTSVEQYCATLGKWFGLSDAQLLGMLPNLANFGGTLSVDGQTWSYPRDLGFMKPA